MRLKNQFSMIIEAVISYALIYYFLYVIGVMNPWMDALILLVLAYLAAWFCPFFGGCCSFGSQNSCGSCGGGICKDCNVCKSCGEKNKCSDCGSSKCGTCGVCKSCDVEEKEED